MFILASASPRRRELLEQIGAKFRIETSGAADVMAGAAADVVRENAIAKATEVAARFPGVPVLGADTVVALDGKIFGKPRDAADARAMLAKIAGRSHEVLTGFAWAVDGEIYSEVAVTAVHFLPMTEGQIADYVATGEPLDKAGGYAVQGRAARFIDKINGSYSNVVGLPLARVAQVAERAQVDMYDDNGEGPTK